jgi:hypothetical protein
MSMQPDPAEVLVLTGIGLADAVSATMTDAADATNTATVMSNQFLTHTDLEVSFVCPSSLLKPPITDPPGTTYPYDTICTDAFGTTTNPLVVNCWRIPDPIPSITTVTPDPVAEGAALTIDGTDLDTVISASFYYDTGPEVYEVLAANFTTQTAVQIVLTVPVMTPVPPFTWNLLVTNGDLTRSNYLPVNVA